MSVHLPSSFVDSMPPLQCLACTELVLSVALSISQLPVTHSVGLRHGGLFSVKFGMSTAVAFVQFMFGHPYW